LQKQKGCGKWECLLLLPNIFPQSLVSACQKALPVQLFQIVSFLVAITRKTNTLYGNHGEDVKHIKSAAITTKEETVDSENRKVEKENIYSVSLSDEM